MHSLYLRMYVRKYLVHRQCNVHMLCTHTSHAHVNYVKLKDCQSTLYQEICNIPCPVFSATQNDSSRTGAN